MDRVAMALVREYLENILKEAGLEIPFEVFTVWKCKTLQNWKFMISSTIPSSEIGGMYFEMTYNGDKKEWYLDAYRKVENRVIQGDKRW